MKLSANKKLNIVMFGHKHMLSREGGIEVVVKELSTRMVKLGHKVRCFDRNSGSGFDERTEYEGVEIVPVLTWNKKGLAPVTSSFFAACHASSSSADIVHIHAEGPAAMCWIPYLFRKRIIVTIHGLDWCREKWTGFASKYIKWGEKQAVQKASEVIVLSKNVQKYFESTYNRKTVFIPNGISRPEIREVCEIKKLWNLEKASYFLFVGRIVPEKGIKYLLEAWKSLKTDKKLVIVGDSSDSEQFVREVKHMSTDNVIFTGFQQGKVLEELYSNAYVYCLPSDIEGMSLSLLEAMSYGNCCVVSNIHENLEVVEDKVVVFPRGNVTKLRNALQQLINEPDIRLRYKSGVSDFICKKYNWDDVVKKTLKVYRGEN